MNRLSFRNKRLEFKTPGKLTGHCRGIYRIYLRQIKKNWKITTCYRLGWTICISLSHYLREFFPCQCSSHAFAHTDLWAASEPCSYGFSHAKSNQWIPRNTLNKCITWGNMCEAQLPARFQGLSSWWCFCKRWKEPGKINKAAKWGMRICITKHFPRLEGWGKRIQRMKIQGHLQLFLQRNDMFVY